MRLEPHLTYLRLPSQTANLKQHSEYLINVFHLPHINKTYMLLLSLGRLYVSKDLIFLN